MHCPNRIKISLAFAVLALLPVLSFAGEERGNNQSGGKAPPMESTESVSRYIGLEVKDVQGVKIGKIQDLMLEPQSGRIAYAVLSSGGLMGIGDDYHLVPWKSLTGSKEENSMTLNISREQLAKAPRRQPEMGDEDYQRQLHRFFGVSPYWQSGPPEMPHGGTADRATSRNSSAGKEKIE